MLKCSLTAHKILLKTVNTFTSSHLNTLTSTLFHNCLLHCKDNHFSAVLQGFCRIFWCLKARKSRKINFFSQRRTNTDKYGRGQFFMSYLCTVESERYGRVFPLATPTNYLRIPYYSRGNVGILWGKTTDKVIRL